MTAALIHHGPRAAERVVSVATRSTPVTVLLPPGVPLAQALTAAMREHGADSGQVELLGGTLGTVSYCIPAECTDGTRAAWFSATREASGPVSIVGGSATVGERDGKPFLHCHAAWMDAAGVLQAGHLFPETTVGPVGLHAVLHPLPGVALRSADDPETLMPVFTPHRNAAALPAEGTRVVMSRVLPGENLRTAADRICIAAGFNQATVRASLGSLVGPAFRHAPGQQPAAPCSEVMALYGRVGPGTAADEPLHGFAVDATGALYGGVLDLAHSPVAVTAELLVVEQP